MPAMHSQNGFLVLPGEPRHVEFYTFEYGGVTHVTNAEILSSLQLTLRVEHMWAATNAHENTESVLQR